MNNRNLLIEDTTFSEERIINTRIHSAFRFRFGCYNRQVKPTATLGDIIDLGEYEVKNYIERIGKKSYQAVIKTLEGYDLYFKKYSKLFKENDFNEYEILTQLKRKGMKVLNKCSFEYFEEDCLQMKIIEQSFEKYMQYLNSFRNKKLPKAKLPRNIDISEEELRKLYSEIVSVKREEYKIFLEEKRLERGVIKVRETFDEVDREHIREREE